MIFFAREPLAAIFESGLGPLAYAHWQEVALDQDVIQLDIDWEGYKQDEESGRYASFTLRRDNDLIGYNGFYVLRPRRYKSIIHAINDVIYLKPEERGIEGIRLILEAEKCLKSMGVTKTFYHVKTDAKLGSPAGDSLERVEDELELEELTGILAQDWVARTQGDQTLGGVLRALGYNHIENHFGKLLTGAS